MKHSLPSYIRSVSFGVGLSLITLSAQAETSLGVHMLLGCNPGELDFSEITQSYTVSSGDTLSGIASQMGIPLSDILLVFSYLYPERSTNSLRIGETIRIPKQDEYSRNVLSSYTTSIENQNDYNEILSFWSDGELDLLGEKYGYELFPNAPIGIGLQAFNDSLLATYALSPIAYGPRVVDVSYQDEIICANLSRSADRFALMPNPLQSSSSAINQTHADIIRFLNTQNIDAWMFTEAYAEVGYTQHFDLREYFNRWMTKGVRPVNGRNIDQYTEALVAMQEYLRNEGVAGTKIPVFYLYTGTSSVLNTHLNGANPNSHVFSYVGEGVNDPFEASFFMPIQNGRVQTNFPDEGISIREYVTYLTQQISSFRYLYSDIAGSRIYSKLGDFADYVDIRINGVKVDILDPNLRVYADDEVQYGGSIVFDGLHIYDTEDQDLRENMNMRLLPLWAVLAIEQFYPTEILEPSEEIMLLGLNGQYNELLRDIKREVVFYLREGDDVRRKYLDTIAYREFGIDTFEELSDSQQREALEEYRLQSLAHQMFGYQVPGGSAWTAGSTKVNAPMYYYDTSNVEEIYSTYVRRKRADYYRSLLDNQCEAGEINNLPFMEIVFFPGDSTSNILYQLRLQLRLYYPYLERRVLDLDRVGKHRLLTVLFGEEVASGVFTAGETRYIGYAEIELALNSFELESDSDFILVDENNNPTLDNDLIRTATTNPTMQYLLRYILANESYINPYTGDDEFYHNFIWPFRGSLRRNLKDAVHRADLLGYTDVAGEIVERDWYQSLISYLPQNISGQIDSRSDIPSITSYGDFQLRFLNLYETNYSELFPWISMNSIVAKILDPNGEYTVYIEDIREQYPEIVEADILLIHQISALLETQEASSGKKLADIFKKLFRLNDGTNSNIIGKIVLLELMNDKLQEHFNNAAMQIQLTNGEVRIEDEDMVERFRDTVILMNNKGETVQVLLYGENYVRRIFETLDTLFPGIRTLDFPSVVRSGGLLDKAQYSRSIFRENLQVFIEILDQYPDFEGKRLLRNEFQTLLGIEYFTSTNIYDFVSSDAVRSVIYNFQIEADFFPTRDEFDGIGDSWRTQMFSYVNAKDMISERISKPAFEAKHFVFPIALISFLTQTIGAMSAATIGIIGKGGSNLLSGGKRTLVRRYGRFKKDIELQRLAKIERKNRKAGKIFAQNVDTTPNYKIDAYLESRIQDPKDLINSETNTASHTYQDGYYRIRGDVVEYMKVVLSTELGNIPDGYYETRNSIIRRVGDIVNTNDPYRLKQGKLLAAE